MAGSKGVAVIAGIGPGTGAAIARRFAKSYKVILLARSSKTLDPLVNELNKHSSNNKSSRVSAAAVGIPTDVTDEASVKSAFATVEKELASEGGRLMAAIYNVGGTLALKPFLEVSTEEMLAPLHANAMGAFHFSQAALPLLLNSVSESTDSPHPSLLFTGATASLRGSAKFGTFAAGKFALRALAQSLGREFEPQGVHVGHVIIDGVIGKAQEYGQDSAVLEDGKKLSPDAIAQTFWMLHSQPKSAWTHELDLRPANEKW